MKKREQGDELKSNQNEEDGRGGDKITKTESRK